MLTVRADIKGTNSVVSVRRSGNTRLLIDLDTADQKELKILFEKGHPFVEEVKQKEKSEK